MLRFLARRCIPDFQNTADPKVRQSYGILCGAVGILFNTLLCIAKLLVGILSGSIAITADALNNLSDAGSSAITLFGFRLAAQKPDTEHPFGHGRFEYIAGLIVSLIILLMGVELGKSSVEKILHPAPVAFHWTSVLVLVLSIGVKCYMAAYTRRIGKEIQSATISAAAADSLSDCLSTGAVLLGTLIAHFTGLHIDGWAGLLVAACILFTGYHAAKDTISPLLGQPPAPELVSEIEQTLLRHKGILGVHDLIVHDYGPGRMFVSAHAEVPANGDILALHDSIDNAERELAGKLGCVASIHMDPVATDDLFTMQLKDKVEAILHAYDERLSLHDFRVVAGPTHTNVIFDIVVPYQYIRSDGEVRRTMQELIHCFDNSLYAVIQIDHSYTGI